MSLSGGHMYNICIAGLGKISRKHIIAINNVKQFNLHSVCDINKQNYINLNNDKIKYYNNYKDALNDKDIDIVDICTPSGMHPDMVIQAAKKGKHIIAENLLSSIINPLQSKNIKKNVIRINKIQIVNALFLEISPLTRGFPCSSLDNLSISMSA